MLHPVDGSSVELSTTTLGALLRLHDRGIRCARGEDPASLFDEALASMMQLASADGGWIHLIDPDTRQSRLVVERGCTPDLTAIGQSSDPFTLSGAPPAGADLVIVEDVQTAPECPEALRHALVNALAVSFQSIALQTRDGQVFGAISTFARTPRRPSEREQHAARVLARCTADFIECHDIHRALEERAIREGEARRSAEAANARKDHFLAMLSHELRQPLSAALPAVEVHKHSPSPERRTRALEVIEQQLRQMVRLVDDLRDATQISQGTMVLRRQHVDLRVSVRHALDMTMSKFDTKHQEVVVDLGPQAARVFADEARMTQVFSNLLHNAASYTPGHGRIGVSLIEADGGVSFRLRDNGIGIPSDALGRIFDVYNRGSQSGDALGSGIGLAVVRQLVELHGGTVTATSGGYAQGSEFIVTLPVARKPAPER